MALKIDKEMRQLARERDCFTWTLTVDGRDLAQPEGVFEIAGPLPVECMRELGALVTRWTKEGLV